MAPQSSSKQTAQKPKKQPEQKRKPKQAAKVNKDADQDRRLRALERKEQGPKVAASFHTSSNFGILVSAGTDAFTRIATVMLHPALLRDPDAEGRTPLAIKASEYSMYRIKRATFRLLPLVGSSAVAGTVVTLALQLDSSEGKPATFDQVSARRHRTGPVGTEVVFTINDMGTAGMHGGWFFTDTAANPGNMTLGPSVDVFSMGQATNVYLNQAYEGGLWQLVIDIDYQFANYTSNAGLAALQGGRELHDFTVRSNEDGEIVVTTAEPLLGSGFTTANAGIGDVVFGVVEAAGEVLSHLPIVGPILSTGLAFLKPLVGAARSNNGGHDYLLCADFDAAKRGDGINHPGVHGEAQGEFKIMQLTPSALQSHSAATGGPVLPNAVITTTASFSGNGQLILAGYTDSVHNAGSTDIIFTLQNAVYMQPTTGTAPVLSSTARLGNYGQSNRIIVAFNIYTGVGSNGSWALMTDGVPTVQAGDSCVLGGARTLVLSGVWGTGKNGDYTSGWHVVTESNNHDWLPINSRVTPAEVFMTANSGGSDPTYLTWTQTGILVATPGNTVRYLCAVSQQFDRIDGYTTRGFTLLDSRGFKQNSQSV
nr:capsid protein [Mamastrovirus sp.]